jgi:2-keto-3-deoxy-L-rhamnonate aldolase RhmA
LQANRVKRVMEEGGHALVANVGVLTDPQIVEIIGLAGFDGAFIDLEHSSLDLRDVQAMVVSAERMGITPIVRTPGFDPAFVLRLLGIGVQGFLMPHVDNAETARAFVRAARFPPDGDRGLGASSRAARFGFTPLLEHIGESNREILLGCLVEDSAAVELVEEIAAVKGLDLIVVGTNDLSKSLGVSGQPNHPELVAAIDRVRAAVERNPSVHLGLTIMHPAWPRSAAELREIGVTYSHCGPKPQTILLRAWQNYVAEARG